jgi:hypothetical protein
MDATAVRKRIESATKLVKSWPLWKQNILVQSASPTVKVPRKPIHVHSDTLPDRRGED